MCMIRRELPALSELVEARVTIKDKHKASGTRVETQGVLAGAYADKSLKALLTHSVDMKTGQVLCKRVKDDHMAGPDEDSDKPPRCQECLKRDPRF